MTVEQPPDGFELGRASWAAIHSLAHAFPHNPTPEDQHQARQFFEALGYLYPCRICASHYRSVAAGFDGRICCQCDSLLVSLRYFASGDWTEVVQTFVAVR